MRDGWVAVLILSLAGCVPWTVVPIEQENSQQQSAAFDAAAYVDSIWESRLLPTVLESAVDLRALLEAPRAFGPHCLVKGRGKVLRVNTESRSGKLELDVAPGVSILMGPVILDTSLRDAAGFIEFSQFVNQLDYAAVANELNARVVTTVVSTLDLAALAGKTVSFHGAATPAAGGGIEIVTVRLDVE